MPCDDVTEPRRLPPMQTSGVFPQGGLTGQRRGQRLAVPVSKVASDEAGIPISGSPGMGQVARAIGQTSILPQKRRRQLTASAPVIGPQGPKGPPNLGGQAPMGNLSTLVKNALRPGKKGF